MMQLATYRSRCAMAFPPEEHEVCFSENIELQVTEIPRISVLEPTPCHGTPAAVHSRPPTLGSELAQLHWGLTPASANGGFSRGGNMLYMTCNVYEYVICLYSFHFIIYYYII